ncbi:MAG: hypothetical protein JRF35_10625 [Deltaproteobacteria bacterium]|nr:hypothetical protein [Deltaproteobacteria bacterium]
MKLGEKAGPFGDAYYGWIIVAVALISMVFWFGIRTSFSVFYVALLEDFAWSRAGSAGIQSMALITYTVLSPIVGGLIDRFGPRSVICPGFWCLLYIGIGGALGSWIGGYLFDVTQSYQWAFVLAIAVFLLFGLFIWIAAPRKIHKG